MTIIESDELRHQVYFERYKTGEVNKIIKIIDDANNRIKKEILKTRDISTKKRYEEINRYLSELSKDIKTNIESGADIDGVIDYETRKQKKFFNAVSKDVNVNFTYPTLKQIKKSALFNPIVPSMTFKSYLNDIQTGFYNQWDTAVRTGYLTNETTQDIIKNVMGSLQKPTEILDKGTMATFRNSIDRNTRTVLQAFANETRREIYSENEKYISGYKYLATLDRRTCEICGKYDGKIFKTLDDCPVLPIHYNCRCVIIPVIKGMEKIADERPDEWGVVEGSLTYKEWLSKLPPELQKEILGVRRYKLYKNGMSFDAFTKDNEILTLKELESKL